MLEPATPPGCLLREITGWSLVQVAGWRDSLGRPRGGAGTGLRHDPTRRGRRRRATGTAEPDPYWPQADLDCRRGGPSRGEARSNRSRPPTAVLRHSRTAGAAGGWRGRRRGTSWAKRSRSTSARLRWRLGARHNPACATCPSFCIVSIPPRSTSTCRGAARTAWSTGSATQRSSSAYGVDPEPFPIVQYLRLPAQSLGGESYRRSGSLRDRRFQFDRSRLRTTWTKLTSPYAKLGLRRLVMCGTFCNSLRCRVVMACW